MELGQVDKKKVELIHVALHQLLDERRKKKEDGRVHQDDDDEETRLLSQLVSKLDSLEKDAAAAAGEEEPSSEIVREIRGLRRQNIITHCLLFVMIGITAFWQLSEISLLLTTKNKLTHPFQTIGDMIQGALKLKLKGQSADNPPVVEAPRLPAISVSELLHVDLPSLTLNGHDYED